MMISSGRCPRAGKSRPGCRKAGPSQRRNNLIQWRVSARALGASVTDAVVMASAPQRGDVVYTADIDDLSRLAMCFPGVRILGV